MDKINKLWTYSVSNAIVSATERVHCNLKTDKTDSGRIFFYKQGSRQRQSNRFWTSCDAQEREGGMTDRMMEEDFKLTPLWIFPNTVYYNTVSLNIV